MKKQEAELQGLEARLSGEGSKEAGLRAALAQYSAIPEDGETPSEPKKPAGGAMIGGGAAVLVLGIILGIIVHPALWALAAVGLALVILGVNANKQFAARMQDYENEKSAAEQRQKARKKKAELDAQLREVQKNLFCLREARQNAEGKAEKNREEIAAWFARYAPDAELTEQAVQTELDHAIQIQALRQKASEVDAAALSLRETEEQFRAGKEELETSFPELYGQNLEAQSRALRTMETNYQVKLAGNQRAEKELAAFLAAEKYTEEELAGVESPALPLLCKEKTKAEKALENELQNADMTLQRIGLSINRENASSVLRRVEQMLSIYRNYRAKVSEREQRQQAYSRKLDELQSQLTAASDVIGGIAEEQTLPERIALARQDCATAKRIRDRLSEIESEEKRLEVQRSQAEHTLTSFLGKYASDMPGENALAWIQAQTDEYAKHTATLEQMESQRTLVKAEAQTHSVSAEEDTLRKEIAVAEKHRDELLVEYTQKTDAIRQADHALDAYPDVVQKIRQLNEQKQKAQAALVTLKRTIQLITRAKENLANRYLGKVESLFNRYMQIWLQSEAVRGILDTDFKITIEENGKVHVAEGYSTGISDLIDFCMRLALVDTLYEKEQPFLILDDPFVNLDEERLEKALELLNVMGANKQIVYFVCHPIRAVEVHGDSASHEEFKRISAATRQSVETRKNTTTMRTAAPKKTPKEMYHIADNAMPLAIQPARKNFTITNSIFSMSFLPDSAGLGRDHSYELFFIDKPGHVLNERQLLEVSNDKLSTERIQFCLNTRDDSGDEYELMIREAGQEDYEVVARIPFKAKLSFAGTFSFS